MSRPEGISAAEVSRMRERLALVEEQVRRSQLEFPDRVTIQNSTGHTLKLTLNIHSHSPSREPPEDELTLNSTFKLPRNSALTHHFTRNGRDYFNPDYGSANCTASSRELNPSPKRYQHEQKFQSTGQWSKIDGAEGVETDDRPRKPKSSQKIKVEDEEVSDVEVESSVRPFTEHPQENKESVSEKPQNESYSTFGNINVVPKKVTPLNSNKKADSEQPSPLVLGYLSQQYQKEHPEAHTDYKKQTQPQQRQNSNSKMVTPIKEKWTGHSSSKQSKLSNILTEPIMPSETKQLKVEERDPLLPITHKKPIIRRPDKSWMVVSCSSEKSRSKSKHQLDSRQKPKAKADQLVEERRGNAFTKSFHKSNTKDHKKDVDRRFDRFVKATKAANDRSSSKRSISPKIQAITDRLSTRQKSPCGHYRLHSETKERQNFNRLVDQNTIASKYMCSEEREELFQLLRNDEESVSLWPMKIVNYTYTKLRKSCSVNYAVLKQ